MARYLAIATALLLCTVSSASAADDLKDRVAKAVAGGQKYLKAARAAGDDGLFGRDGINAGAGLSIIGGNGSGTPVLTGLALIESGLDTKDPTVAGIVSAVRRSYMNTNSTYELSLMIMFLDRLAAKQDDPIIQFLTLRLMSGQTTEGGWFYTCDGLQLDPVQSRRLSAELGRGSKLSTPGTPLPIPKKETRPRDEPVQPKKEPEPKKEAPPAEPKVDGLHPALEEIAGRIRAGMGGMPGGIIAAIGAGVSGDHSNTQFATVALWCGRRHGVNVSAALKLLDKHYRDVQGRDGGWGYALSEGVSSPSMTCAGLVGLAIGIGAKNLEGKGSVQIDPETIAQDRSVELGLKYLGTFLKAAGEQRDARGGGFQNNDLTNDLYFMWSLERVGMAYGLQTIGNLDWYDWGARVLLSSQAANGSWGNRAAVHGSTENATAFALLFLMRSNLAQEVSISMKGKVKDPGTSRLVGGGDLSKIIGESSQGKANSKRPGPVTTPRPKDDTPLSPPETDKGGKLATALENASAAERADLLTLYRDSKGGEYTDALARAATKMTGEALAQVRDALAQRLTRMTISTLNDFMKDGDRELRRSSALAAGSKSKDRIAELAPTLVRLIGDDEPMVVQAARASLRTLSGQDFGPEAGAAPSERGKALIAWRSWWEGQKK
ncbi:MAG: hypothetical protein EXS09_22175 [Gemmataceae bacterium]|nr:hypothetical protein [Gemmataceae bacterium]